MSYSISLVVLVLVSIVLGYLFGSLMWSIIIGKVFFKKDPRDYESKNPGATNSSRIYGKKVAIIILLLDILKSFIPVIVCWMIARYAMDLNNHINANFNPYTLVFLSGLFAIIGHMWPIYFKFRGGKGVATYGGMLISMAPFMALSQLLILICLILITKYVSLSALISTILSWFLIFVPGLNYNFVLCHHIGQLLLINFGNVNWILVLLLMIIVATTLIWIKHRKNIVSLINNTERQFKLFK